MSPLSEETIPAPDETALVRAVVAAPDDDTPRLVYADWLEERGRTERARLIRLQCNIETERNEVDELIRRHGREWAGELFAVGGDDWKFHRGFPEEVTLRFDDFMAHHARLNDTTPLCRLHLRGSLSDDMDADLAALARLPAAKQIRALAFARPVDPSHPTYGAEGVRALARSPHLSGLRELALYSPRVGPDGVAAVADSPVLANLTRLVVTDPACGADESCLRGLVRSPHLPNLTSVELGDGPPVAVQGVREIAAARVGRSGPGVGR